MMAGQESNQGNVGGKQVLSHFTNPALLPSNQ